ncbi:uncharacterized protein [Miscanthus floridulus]|uniref:uncharacterized protein n=1 Tax=Miscanthus floridulus TaxID=154761 RepID=UPI003458AEEA
MAEEQIVPPVAMPGMVGAAVRPQSPPVVPRATVEEDEVEEIERAEPQPQSVRIIRKCGEEVVVIKEENTTKEMKRLRSAVAGVMTQIEGIMRIVEQRHQLIKRMEPLAKENKKLQEAMNLYEKNIQRARRERDFAESNSRDLEHQKGVLSEQLAAATEQLQRKSDQLAAASEQLQKKTEQLAVITILLAERDVELGQLRKTVEQIQQEKTKESERANKLTEELKGYRRKAKAQFDVLVQEAQVQKDNFNAVVTAIKPVLDCVDLETAPRLDGRRQGSDTIIQRSKAAWENFKIFNRDAIMTVATHVLAVVRSHYPTINVQSIGGGFAKGLSDAETQKLEDEVEDAAKKLAGDIDLFGETDGSDVAQ